MKCLILLLLGSFIISAFGKVEFSKNNVTFYTKELMSTTMPYCNNKTGLSCPNSNHDRDSRMMFCGLSCPQGTLYRCKEDADHGIIEFCAKREICDKGQMNKVYFDEEHQRVVIQKDVCPGGFFQPFEEDCFIACTEYRHVDESFLPDLGIAVLHHGNSTNAGVGYCDVDHGYVNMDYNMYINLTLYEVSVCDKSDNYENKCVAGQRLLPDSRCASICQEGYVVDKENYFKCSKKSRNDTVIAKSSTQVPSISGISPSKHITSSIITSTLKPSTIAQQSIGAGITAIIILRVVIGLVVIVVCYIGWRLRQKRNKKREKVTLEVVAQDMMEMKSLPPGSSQDENCDETEVLKLVD